MVHPALRFNRGAKGPYMHPEKRGNREADKEARLARFGQQLSSTAMPQVPPPPPGQVRLEYASQATNQG